ncbi:hypothetical protein LMG27177_02438 [Paraburkholderia fynbosensis]|uniref:Uncharacterized protein n=1 Tax=Paraburkholderia fynbosensis TaxID=1200993 RepID=A0A6J5FX59_9BURK|nr:hypothetical protein LMG27177_02438 [Paraburkholderia fynbosensis]
MQARSDFRRTNAIFVLGSDVRFEFLYYSLSEACGGISLKAVRLKLVFAF